MDWINNVVKSNWYGDRHANNDIVFLRDALDKAATEKDTTLLLIELLKSGDFAAKTLLFQMMNTTKDEHMMNLYIRLFCSVAAHKDLLKNENLLFLSDLSENNANTFAANAVYTLSYDAVPYLLAMLEEWEDTNVEETIRNSLDIFLDYSEELDKDAAVEEIGDFYLNFIEKVNVDNYYYYSAPVFTATLAKKMIEKSVASLNDSAPVRTNVIPSLLSIWSGIKCPVQYGTIVDNALLAEIYQYTQALSKMNWEAGVKYFYGHQVI